MKYFSTSWIGVSRIAAALVLCIFTPTICIGQSSYFHMFDVNSINRDSITPIKNNPYTPNNCTTNSEGSICEVMPSAANAGGDITNYQQSITPSGALSIQVPIEIPAKGNRFIPTVSLRYNSQDQSISNVGLKGWQLSYGPSINRVERVEYYDGQNREIKLDMLDGLLLDGTRLFRLPNQASNANPIHMKTTDGDIYVKAYTQTFGSQTFYTYFDVFYPNGIIYRLGYTDESTTRLSYPATQAKNIRGDLIRYKYVDPHAAHPLIRSISYGRHDTVRFAYANAIPDIRYRAGQEMKMDKYLKEILVDCAPSGIATDDPRYSGQTYVLDTMSYRFLPVLKSIGRKNNTETLKRVLTFGYGKKMTEPRNYLDGFLKMNKSMNYHSSRDLRVSSGRIFPGSPQEGYLMFPNRSVYQAEGITTGRKYRNDYNRGYMDSLLITHSFDGAYSAKTMPMGRGFFDAILMDIDDDRTDEIVRLNSWCVTSNDLLLGDSTEISIFKLDKQGGINQSSSYQFSTFMGPYEYHHYTNVVVQDPTDRFIPKTVLIGEFLRNKKNQLLIITHTKINEATIYLFDPYSNMRYPVAPSINWVKDTAVLQNGVGDSIRYSDRIFAIDFNGDGRKDVCRIAKDGIHFYDIQQVAHGYTLVEVGFSNQLNWNNVNNYASVLPGDFNGDGCTDFLAVQRYNPGNDPNYITGDRWFSDNVNPSCGSSGGTFLAKSGNPTVRFVQYQSPGKFSGLTQMSTKPFNINKASLGANEIIRDINTYYMCSDVDKDGKSDLVEYRIIGTSAYALGVYYFLQDSNLIRTEISFNCPREILLGSQGYANGSRANFVVLSEQGMLRYIAPSLTDSRQRLITGIQSLGKTSYFNYQDIGETIGGNRVYHPDTCALSSDYEHQYMGMMVVSREEKVLHGIIQDTIRYRYAGGISHKKGLGFLGFKQRITESRNYGFSTSTFDPFHFGALLESENDRQKLQVEYQYRFISQTKEHKELPTSTHTYDKVKGKSKHSFTQYDDKGFVTCDSSIYTPQYKNVIRNSYDHRDYAITTNEYPNPYLLGLSASNESLQYTPSGLFNTSKERSYDDRGNILLEKSYRNGLLIERDSFEYDYLIAWNRRSLLTYAQKSVFGRVTQEFTYWYDLITNQLIETQEHYSYPGENTEDIHTGDYFIAYTTYTYNEHGDLYQSVEPTGETITYGYDSWGKQVSHQAEGGPRESEGIGGAGDTTSLSYIPPYTTTKYTFKGEHKIKVDFYDGNGNLVLESSGRPYGSKDLCVAHQYDRKGRRKRTSLPFKTAPTIWIKYSYDHFDRLICADYPNHRLDTYAYIGDSIISIVDRKRTIKKYDSFGRVQFVKDTTGIIQFFLRPDGQPDSIVSPTNTIILNYDIYGRTLMEHDPKNNTKHLYEYDEYGMLTKDTKNNGSFTAYLYQLNGLLHSKKIFAQGQITPEQEIFFTYDAFQRPIGEKGPNRIRKFSYDEIGRIGGYRDSLPTSGKTYARTYSYDGNGEISSIGHFTSTRPLLNVDTNEFMDELLMEHRSYSQGVLMAIRVGDKLIYTRDDENEMGFITLESKGNGKHNYHYSPFGEILYSQFKDINNKPKVRESYSYTLSGQLSTQYRWDNSNTNILSRTYRFDDLNRLVDTNETPAPISYDPNNGNLTSISGVAEITYGNSAQPFAPQSMQLLNPRYKTLEHHISYNAQDLPIRIEEVSSSSVPKLDRYVHTYTYDGMGEKTQSKLITRWTYSPSYIYDYMYYERFYFHDDYEIHNEYGVTKEIIYLGGNAYNAPACMSRYPNERVYEDEWDEEGSPDPWEPSFILRDIQNNIVQVVSYDGRTARQHSQYTEWGYIQRWSSLSTDTTQNDPRISVSNLFLGRGFGSHEQLLELGLIHMNARLYDPVLARFLSPDPVLQDPENSLNYNRYCYAFNNPFAYWDPTGRVVRPYLIDPKTGTYYGGVFDDCVVEGKSPLTKWSELEDILAEARERSMKVQINQEDLSFQNALMIPAGEGVYDFERANNAFSLAGLGWGITELSLYNKNFWLGKNMKYYSTSWKYGNQWTGTSLEAMKIARPAGILGRVAFGFNLAYGGSNIASGVVDRDYSKVMFSGLGTIYSGIATYGGIPGMIMAGPMALIDATIGLNNFLQNGVNLHIDRANRISQGDYSMMWYTPGRSMR